MLFFTRKILKLKGRKGNILDIFYHPLVSQVAIHCQYLEQSIIKNMKCYYRENSIRNLIHHFGMIQDLQSCCNIKVSFLMLPRPGLMFKVEAQNEFGENTFIAFLSTPDMLCLTFWVLSGNGLKIKMYSLYACCVPQIAAIF